jgi:hypothetical protein
VRILSSTAYKGGPFAPADVIAGLKTLIQKTDHTFWADSLSILENQTFDFAQISSGKLTDAYLLALAHTNNARFATLDAAININPVRGMVSANVIIIA